MARLTLNGMYDYDPTLFEGMILPEDYDRDALLFEILQRSGQLYPYHQQPAMLKTAIRLWFARNFLNFDRTMEALMAEYNPIENYDRHEYWKREPDLEDSDVRTGSDTLSHTGDDTLSHTGDDTLSHTGDDTLSHTGDDTLSHTGDDTLAHSKTDTTVHDYTGNTPYTETMKMSGPHTTEEQVSAFDSNTYQESKKTIETFGGAADREDERKLSGKYEDKITYGHEEKTTYNSDEKTTFNSDEKTTYNSDEKTTYNSDEKTTYNSDEKTIYGSTFTGRHTGKEEYTSRIHGNIGVTTSQQMIESEIELRKFDIYTDIAARFEHEFLVQVY